MIDKWFAKLIVVSLVGIGCAFASTPISVTVANVHGAVFNVVWYSNTSENGAIKCGTSTASMTTYNDLRGPAVFDKLHIVRVNPLLPNTQYFFSVVSGLTEDTNLGNYYSVQTAAASGLSTPIGSAYVNTIYKYLSTTITANKDMVVFAKVQDGSGAESLTNCIVVSDNASLNQFAYNAFRYPNLSGFYYGAPPATDKIILWAWSSTDGFGGRVTLNTISGATTNIYLDSMALTSINPLELITPNQVSLVLATPTINGVILQWQPSTSNNNAGTYIVRSTSNYPASVTGGVLAYNGIGSSNVDLGLQPGVTYYYSLFAYNGYGIYSSGVTVSAVPVLGPDLIPPTPVTAVNINTEPGTVILSWIPSLSADSAGTKILRKIGLASVSVTDGVVIDIPGAASSYVDTNLTPNFTYNYVLYAYDYSANLASGVTVSAIPTLSSGVLLDNYDTGAILAGPSYLNLFGWYDSPFNDSGNGGNSSYTFTLDNSAAIGTTKSIRIGYTLGNNSYQDRFIGFSLNVANNSGIDMSQYKAIEFWAKGSGNKLSFKLNAIPTNASYNSYFIEFNTTANWKRYVVNFADLVQPAYGPIVSITAAVQNMIGIQYMPSSKIISEAGWFNLDEIKFLTNNVASNISASVVVVPVPVVYITTNMLADFENAMTKVNWGGYAWSYDDRATPNFGNSVGIISINAQTAAKSTVYSAYVSYNLGSAYQAPFAGLGINLSEFESSVNVVASYNGVEFWAKGDGHLVALELGATNNVAVGIYSTWNYFYYEFRTTSNWTKYTIPYTQFAQPAWGPQVSRNVVLANLLKLQFKASSAKAGETGWFNIDEVSFVTRSIVVPVVSTVTINRVSANSVNLSWSNDGNASWIVLRSTSNFAVDRNDGQVVASINAATLTENGLALDQRYYYSVFAKNAQEVYSMPKKAVVRLTASDMILGQASVSDNMFIEGMQINSGNYIGKDVTLSVLVEIPVTNGAQVTLNVSGALTSAITLNSYLAINTVDIRLLLPEGDNLINFSVVDWNGQVAQTKSLTLKRDSVIFSNFENNSYKNYYNGYSYVYNEAPIGNSVITSSIVGSTAANGTKYSASVSYALGNVTGNIFAGFGINISPNQDIADISKYTGIEFWVKGDGHQLSVELGAAGYLSPNYYAYNLGNTQSTWNRYVIPFISFAQPAWGVTLNVKTVLQNFKALQFKASSQLANESGAFAIDEVKFVTFNIVTPTALTAFNVSDYSVSANSQLITFNVYWSVPAMGVSTRVLKKTNGYSVNPNDGTIIYQGVATSVLDGNVTKDQTYYYSAFTYDENGLFSDPSRKAVRYNTDGGLKLGWLDISANICISANGSQKVVLNYDYVDSAVTLSIYIHTNPVSANAVCTINLTGAVTKVVTFNPSVTNNLVLVGLTLTQNVNQLNFQTLDWDGNLSAVKTLVLKVAVGEAFGLKAGSQILVYPMPYNPDAGNMSVSYELTRSGDLEMLIYDLNGNLVYRDKFFATSEGAKAGYNEVVVNRLNSFGSKWANGLYVIRLVSNKKYIGTGKYMVIR